MRDNPKAFEFLSKDCVDFQKQLPELFESGSAVSNHPHLQSCHQCSSLVRDLEYIAQQAKELMAPTEPRDAVWQNIEMAIQQEAEATDRHSRVKTR